MAILGEVEEVEAHSEVEEEEEAIQVEAAFSSLMDLRLQFTVRIDSIDSHLSVVFAELQLYHFCPLRKSIIF